MPSVSLSSLAASPSSSSSSITRVPSMTEHIHTEQSNMPTFVKQLLLLVLPSKQQQAQADNKNQGNSPFEKMYFSFPALEEDSIDGSSNTCGQQQDQRHKTKSSATTTNSSIIC
ncbi:hypothetical protein MUCCIDRAFT_115469 [Mucor lusitanicus CBS 277.49]|uniref:Uncharacterized protein n=1 Tax=Mucor lusitanicus CBS 277.49 TaxID=747725 RepID=A0A168HA42_MUCCL|nr:hypothetical protein MUCCIDRAFT_115469 [Mucor lusitanicus CBS 277.49]